MMKSRPAKSIRPGLLVVIAVATALGVFGGSVGSVRAQGLYDVMVSPLPDRSGAVLLQGEIVTGDMAVFVTPEAGITKVKWFLDGIRNQTERNAPWDFNGTNADDTANLYDTTQIADGLHTITAEITLSAGGLETVSATFNVANSGPALLFSPDTLSFAVEVAGSNSAQVSLDTSDATVASYTVSGGASWLSVNPLSGSTPDTPTVSVDATGLAVGTYTATVSADSTGYISDTLNITLNVVNTLAPDQVHLAWVDDPSTTLTIVWRTLDPASPSTVEYRPLGDATWQSATGAPRPSGTQGTLHEATLTSLTPSTTYEYRVLGGGSTWSAVFTTRTAPPPGPADFDAIYVADTGIAGRLDGLTTGTQQVIDEIANLNPLVVLLGGDYAYYNTDDRFATLDEAIDAWFNQMQPISTQSPMMPAYGNHEILLGEGYAPWADRFPTPEGFDNRKNYSFDVGDVHFVSIMAVSGQGTLSDATVQWIQQDITDALNAGQTWVVPFFHVSPFADGKNHSSNLNLRAQLGPLFESLGVKLVISSHDQAYERTYPLTDVPATNTPTSTSLTCYTMADGVTWVKVSPGGKLSNKNGNFSKFATEPPPAWTAFRDNTMHHFTRLIVSASGSIQVDTYGVIGDGTPPLILDSFQYTVGACPPELQFSPDTLSFTVDEGGSDSAPVNLDTNDATVASYTVSDDAGWLTVSPLSGSTPDTLTLSVDTTGLAAGTYIATVTATASGYLSDTLTVTLNVGGAFNLLVSSFPDRSSAVPLEGASVMDGIAVFVSPDTGITQVRFYLDGILHQTENKIPWDFKGTASNGAAKLYDTTQLADGLHTISAEIDLSAGGTEVVSSTFTVANNAPALVFSPDTLTFSVQEGGSASDKTTTLDTNDATVASYTVSDDAPWLTVSPLSGSTPDTVTISVDTTGLTPGIYNATVTATASGYLSDTLTVTLNVGGAFNLLVSSFPDRSSAVPLEGASVMDGIAVFVSPDTGITQVRFYLDGILHQTENKIPWDFKGTASNGAAKLYDTTQLADGLHTISAEIDLSAGGTEVVSSTFTVANNAPALVFSPDTLTFSVQEGGSASDKTTTLDTNDATVASYTVSDDAPWLTVSPLSGSTPDTVTISVDTTGLTPGIYNATVTATASGYLSDTLTVTLNVGGAFNLLVSSFPDRSSAVLLQDETVMGDMAVFVSPEVGITKVKFFLDGTRNQTERNAPWDFNGTNPNNTAKLYDTTQIADGLHNITAEITLSGGGLEVVSATFTVVPPWTYQAATGSREIDGAVSDWAGVPLLNVPLKSLDGTQQIDADLQVSFDNANVYVLVSVHDDYNSNPGQHELSGSLAVMWAIDEGAGPHMGTDGVNWFESLGMVDVWHWEIDCGPGVVSGGIDRTVDGNDPVCNLDDEYALTPFERWDDDGDNRLMGVYDHTGRVTGEDSPGTWYWEISRPLTTLDAQDAQFAAGGTAKLALAYWDPDETPLGWTGAGHLQSAYLEWITVEVPADLGPALQFSPDVLSFSVEEGGSTTPQTVGLDTNDATVASYTVSDDAGWLTVSPLSGSTPDTVTISVDATGLTGGIYNATVTATSPDGYLSDTLAVTLNVGGSYGLFVSPFADRSSAVLLQSETISGDMAVFVSPETAIARVRFLLDGVLHQSENRAPWDFNGTAGSGDANLYNSGQLLDGLHTITAEIDLSAGGTEVVSATFTADNGCSLVPCSEILVSLPYILDFSQDQGQILDANGVGTGFTYIDPPTNGTGYIPQNLVVDTAAGTLQVTTTAGSALGSANSQDNALGVGVDAPSQTTIFSATLLGPPVGTGNDEQAGLWFGTGEDDYVKLVVVSTAGGTIIEYLMEVGGSVVEGTATGILDLSAATVELKLRADPTDQTVVGSYSINGGPSQVVETFIAPGEFFSFDAAGINPVIGTRSFAWIAANSLSPLVYTFDEFSVTGQSLPGASTGDFTFKTSSFPVAFPTSLAWGPDDRLYVTEMLGTIHALTYDADKQVVDDEVITTLTDDYGAARLTLGIAIDPLSTPSNVILWVSHSNGSVNNGLPNTGTVSRLSGPGFTTIEHIITGLPRAIANHATNSIHFGPDDRLYIAQGGNTGAGAPNTSNSEFGDMEEQPLSAAILVADVRDPAFDGSCNNPSDIFGPPPCDVAPYATGLRNAYDFVFHSNGSMYAADNGLGVTGTFPPSPTPPCFGFGDTAKWDEGGNYPGTQPDELFRIEQGGYYGHPNPYRDECVFKDGSFQGVPPLPNWVPPILNLGKNKSANGIIEYASDAFCSALQGVLMIANYSVGDDITVIRLSADGL
ncbi:MAG: fibronectin type III domain-containing protein, partial [Dehalococcoidia bacterium]